VLLAHTTAAGCGKNGAEPGSYRIIPDWLRFGHCSWRFLSF